MREVIGAEIKVSVITKNKWCGASPLDVRKVSGLPISIDLNPGLRPIFPGVAPKYRQPIDEGS